MCTLSSVRLYGKTFIFFYRHSNDAPLLLCFSGYPASSSHTPNTTKQLTSDIRSFLVVDKITKPVWAEAAYEYFPLLILRDLLKGFAVVLSEKFNYELTRIIRRDSQTVSLGQSAKFFNFD